MKQTSGWPQRLGSAFQSLPVQFWLLLAGGLVSSTGASMIWPFLSSYLKQRLSAPLTTVTLLLTINSTAGLFFSFVGGVLADRIGRKGVMVVSLFSGVVYFLLMGQSGDLLFYAVLLAFWGAMNPLYSIGANAMVADLVPADRRLDAYSYIRIVHNVGVAVGPILGGLFASVSINRAFYVAAATFLVFALFVLFLIKETLQKKPNPQPGENQQPSRGNSGFSRLFRDRVFLGFVLSFTVTNMAAALVFLLLPVYTSEQFGMPENRYSFIVTINALMVIFVQFIVTRMVRNHSAMPVLAVGALFYAVGVGSIALGRGFWYFAFSMIIMTTGELVMTPTATSLVASLAPPDMRGRYMSVYSLTWPVAQGIGPVLGGLLYDHISPASMWVGGAVFGLISALGFFLLWRAFPQINRNASASEAA